MLTRLSWAGIGMVLCITAMPVAIAVTIFMIPLWSWLENTFAIESIGHSGPAEWCYILTYLLVLIVATFTWWAIKRQRKQQG